MKIVMLERNSAGLDIPVNFDELGEVTYYANTVTHEDIIERIKDADIIVSNKTLLAEETLKNATNVKLICQLATGFDNCDLEYCKSRGIIISNVVDYSTDAVAQHTFTLVLALLEKLVHYDNYVKSGTYANQARFSNFDIPYTELSGKTWGIIGMGNIGKMVAKIASAFGCKVIFHSITGRSSVTEYEQVDFETLLSLSDVLSLHCPLTALTKNLIDAKALKQMKPTSILINVARGQIINNTDLYHALEDGTIMAAGLDVLEHEPLQLENPLSRILDSSKLIITPHLAWASVESRTRCVEGVRDNIKAYLNGTPQNIVNK